MTAYHRNKGCVTSRLLFFFKYTSCKSPYTCFPLPFLSVFVENGYHRRVISFIKIFLIFDMRVSIGHLCLKDFFFKYCL